MDTYGRDQQTPKDNHSLETQTLEDGKGEIKDKLSKNKLRQRARKSRQIQEARAERWRQTCATVDRRAFANRVLPCPR